MATTTERPVWATSSLPPLVGQSEALEILGVHKTTLGYWLRQGKMIEPLRVRSGPIWVRADVEAFAACLRRGEVPRPAVR